MNENGNLKYNLAWEHKNVKNPLHYRSKNLSVSLTPIHEHLIY